MRAANQVHTAYDAMSVFGGAPMTGEPVFSSALPRKTTAADQGTSSDVMIAVMGGTGTGKSTFINLLTNDKNIHIGHRTDSDTFNIQTARYIDEMTGQSVTLIDTPGFDDSRDGVTDTDILEKIVRFLEPEEGERRKLNGIIYMHRISDPRVGGVSRKNLRMFRSLCGDENLGNVRIVTTNWGRVGKEEGDEREKDLRNGAFKDLIRAGADMRRHLNTAESARAIMSELIPLDAVTMKIQDELEAGLALGDTSAGTVLTAEMREMQKKHEKEMGSLKREMEDAAKANDLALRAELAEERRALEQKMARAEEDRERLARTLDEARKDLAVGQDELRKVRQQNEEQSTALKRVQDQMDEERKRLTDQIKAAEEMRLKLEREQQEAMRNSQRLMDQFATERRELQEKAEKQSAALRDIQSKMEEEKRRLSGQMAAAEEKRRKLEVEQQEAMRNSDRLMQQLAAERREQAEKHAATLKDAQRKMEEEAKQLVMRMKADEDKRRKMEEEQWKSRVEYERRMQQETAEREMRASEARANEIALHVKAEEARRKQVEMQAQMERTEREKRELKYQAERGVFGKFAHEMGHVVKTHTERDGLLGAVGGLALAPVVGGWRTVFGR